MPGGMKHASTGYARGLSIQYTAPFAVCTA
jgi:hypothetical protein